MADIENIELEINEAIVEATSPTASVSKVGDTATITITDINGTTTATVKDGAKGDTGDKGETGEQGPTGATGPIGPTPEFSMGTVSTLPAGSDATATITGTAGAPVLNLGIPKGDPGEVTEDELEAVTGDLDNLTTTDQSNLVAAINEVDDHADTNSSSIGTLSSLTTTAKDNLVAAVNELDDGKVDKISGKGLSTNDYTTTEKTKLSGIQSGAEVNRTYTAVTGKPTADAAPGFGDTVTISQVAQDTTGQITATDKTITMPDATATTSTDGLMAASDKQDIADLKEDLDNKANIDGAYEGMTVGNAEQLISKQRLMDKAPYLFRTAGGGLEIGDREYDKLVGASAVVNQIVPTAIKDYTNAIADNRTYFYFITRQAESPYTQLAAKIITTTGLFTTILAPAFTGYIQLLHSGTTYNLNITDASTIRVISGHKYILSINFTGIDPTTVGGLSSKDLHIIDVTQFFGASAIPDRANVLENGTAGSGIAWLKSYGFFTKPYYLYNAGTLQSTKASKHKMVGFNQWDEVWELGAISNSDGQNSSSTTRIRSKNYIRVLPNTTYYARASVSLAMYKRFYDAEKNYLGQSYSNGDPTNRTFVTPTNAYYMRFYMIENYGTTYNHDICINFHWDGSRDGEYEQYKKWEYDLPNTELRGRYTLDANNNIVAYGDTRYADGHTDVIMDRVDLGTLNWTDQSTTTYTNRFKANISGAAASPQMICNGYIYKGVGGYGNVIADDKSFSFNNGVLNFHDSSCADADAMEAALSGVYLYFEKATPTTETTDPYTTPQIVDNWGTEEYIDGRTVEMPVGHETEYPANLRDKIEAAPNSPSVDGLYLMKRESGENTYDQYVDPVPTLPSTDGTYILKVTVSGGTKTKQWVAE